MKDGTWRTVDTMRRLEREQLVLNFHADAAGRGVDLEDFAAPTVELGPREARERDVGAHEVRHRGQRALCAEEEMEP